MTAVLLTLSRFCHDVVAEMPSAAEQQTVAEDGVTVEDGGAEVESGARRLRKEHGVYVEYIDGERTDHGLEDLKGTKMTWGEGVVRTYNRSIVSGEDHPGKNYAESIKVFDINHQQLSAFRRSLEQFYSK